LPSSDAYAGGVLFLGICDKLGQTEIKDVISSDHKHIVIKSELVNSELNILDGAKSYFVSVGFLHPQQ
jgi:hypothetical protein